MSGHPQTTPRGLWAAKRMDVGTDGIFFTPYSTTTALLDSNSTALTIAGGIQISGAQTITANSSGFVHADPVSALPGDVDNGVLWGIGSNSTGVFIYINSTGTTHKYLNVTTVQPT